MQTLWKLLIVIASTKLIEKNFVTADQNLLWYIRFDNMIMQPMHQDHEYCHLDRITVANDPNGTESRKENVVLPLILRRGIFIRDRIRDVVI